MEKTKSNNQPCNTQGNTLYALGLAWLGSARPGSAHLRPAPFGLERLNSAQLGLAPLGLGRRRAARVSSVWFGVLA
jgi:hypothetical protein